MSSTYSLSDFDLRSTPCRLDVLSSFQAVDFALSQGDIEQKLSEQYDRVTIYRTLKTFLTSGLLHKVLDDNGGVKYALCKELCHQVIITTNTTTCISNAINAAKLPV